MQMRMIQDPKKYLATVPNPGEEWLCCNRCDRFFQLKNARGKDVGCPFCCDYGLGLGIFLWDDMREPEDPRWPKSAGELTHGQRAPEPHAFDQWQLSQRIHALIVEYERSPECIGRTTFSSYFIVEFLQMMSDLCWDLTVTSPCSFSEELASAVVELPAYAHTACLDEAPRMAAELVAFFRFAARAKAVQDAEEWLEYLQSMDLVDHFRFTMEHDARLERLRELERKRAS